MLHLMSHEYCNELNLDFLACMNAPSVGPGMKRIQHAKNQSKQKHDRRQINDGGIIAFDNILRTQIKFSHLY